MISHGLFLQDRETRSSASREVPHAARASWTVKRPAGCHDRRGALVGQTFRSVPCLDTFLYWMTRQAGMPVLLVGMSLLRWSGLSICRTGNALGVREFHCQRQRFVVERLRSTAAVLHLHHQVVLV